MSSNREQKMMSLNERVVFGKIQEAVDSQCWQFWEQEGNGQIPPGIREIISICELTKKKQKNPLEALQTIIDVAKRSAVSANNESIELQFYKAIVQSTAREVSEQANAYDILDNIAMRAKSKQKDYTEFKEMAKSQPKDYTELKGEELIKLFIQELNKVRQESGKADLISKGEKLESHLQEEVIFLKPSERKEIVDWMNQAVLGNKSPATKRDQMIGQILDILQLEFNRLAKQYSKTSNEKDPVIPRIYERQRLIMNVLQKIEKGLISNQEVLSSLESLKHTQSSTKGAKAFFGLPPEGNTAIQKAIDIAKKLPKPKSVQAAPRRSK